MTISHVCTECGTELAGIAPRVEPVYGWTLVACPRCRGRYARQDDPRAVGVRFVKRLGLAVIVLGANMIACGFLLVLAAASCRGGTSALASLGMAPSLIFSPGRFADALSSLDRARLIEWLALPDAFLLISFVCASALAGLWVEIGLSHWPIARRWLAWTAGIVAVSWLIEFSGPLEVIITGHQRFWPSARLLWGAAGDALRAQSPMALLSVLPAAAGGLLGRAALLSIVRRRDQLRRIIRSHRARRLAQSRPAHRKTLP